MSETYQPQLDDMQGPLKVSILGLMQEHPLPLTFSDACNKRSIAPHDGYLMREGDAAFHKAVGEVERIMKQRRADFAQDALSMRVAAGETKAIEVELNANARDRGYGKEDKAAVNINVNGITPEQIEKMSEEQKLQRMQELMTKAMRAAGRMPVDVEAEMLHDTERVGPTGRPDVIEAEFQIEDHRRGR